MEGDFGLGRAGFGFVRGDIGSGCDGFGECGFGVWGGTGLVRGLAGRVFGSGELCGGMGDWVWGLGRCFGLVRVVFGLARGGVGGGGTRCWEWE